MKFKDIKVGQILEDRFGNKYEVMDITGGTKCYPVSLRCVGFRKIITIDNYTTVTGLDQTFWIVRDRLMLLSIEEGPGRFIKENFYSSLALSNSLEYITLEVQGGRKRDYILGRREVINKIGLTLSELEVLGEDYLREDNVKMRMKVIDGLGNEYIVSDYGTEAVKLLGSFKITTINGEARNVDMVIRVPYYKVGTHDNMCTTKDFKIVKD